MPLIADADIQREICRRNSCDLSSKEVCSFYEAAAHREARGEGLSVFLQDENRIAELTAAFKKIEEGRADAALPTPSRLAIDRSKVALQRLRFYRLLPERVIPSAEGGVVLYFTGNHGRKAYLEYGDDGETVMASYDKHSNPQVLVFAGQISEVQINELKSHLGGQQ